MSSDWVAYVDGEWRPAEAASVNVLDHGLLYGDGVFEGIRVYGGRPFLLDAHLRRLEASARALALDLPLDRAAMGGLCREGARPQPASTTATCASSSPAAAARSASRRTRARAPSLILIAAPLALYPPSATARRAHRHLGPAPLRARRAAAAGQEPQLPDQRAGVDRGAPPGRRGGDAAERAGPHRRVHRPTTCSSSAAGACARPPSRTARSAASRARSSCDLLGELGIAGRGGAHARRRLDGRRDVPDRHRRRDRAGARGRRPARCRPRRPVTERVARPSRPTSRRAPAPSSSKHPPSAPIAPLADADEPDRDAEPLGDERDITLRGRRQILEVRARRRSARTSRASVCKTGSA